MKNLKVSVKLLVGFGIAIIFTLTVGIVGIISLSGVNKEYVNTIDVHGKPLYDAGHVLEGIHAMRAELRGAIIFSGNEKMVAAMEANINQYMEQFEASTAEFSKYIVREDVKGYYDEAMNKYQKEFKPGARDILAGAKRGVPVAELAAQMAAVTKPAADFVSEKMTQCMDIKKQMLQAAEEKGEAHSKTSITTMVICIIGSLVISIIFGIYISSLISKPVNALREMMKNWRLGHLTMRLNIRDRTDEIGEMAKIADLWSDDLQNVICMWLNSISEGDVSMEIPLRDPDDEIAAAFSHLVKSLREILINDGGSALEVAAQKNLTKRVTGEYKGVFAKMKDNINTVLQNLDEALSHVTESVTQVTGASNEISGGAQNLADGANEQASSLEEVSSSLEEMSSMTKQNADNSNQAKILASEARSAANEGDASMKRMADAIRQIKTSSDNTAKIIKTIDDIAFQTNLLALNAAVEAARAGEAGKGFAVVAEEVRNLAMRSAEAAKNTANMIEESVKNADGGVKITEEVAKSLSQIVDRAGKVGDLIAEIAAASNEQALGIEQVNTAVASMNQVTQRNAANAEESASASEELSSQAAELANMVSAFTLSLAHDPRSAGRQRARRSLPPPNPQQRPVIAALTDKSGKSKSAGSKLNKPAKAVRAEEVIPLDDDELKDF